MSRNSSSSLDRLVNNSLTGSQYLSQHWSPSHSVMGTSTPMTNTPLSFSSSDWETMSSRSGRSSSVSSNSSIGSASSMMNRDFIRTANMGSYHNAFQDNFMHGSNDTSRSVSNNNVSLNSSLLHGNASPDTKQYAAYAFGGSPRDFMTPTGSQKEIFMNMYAQNDPRSMAKLGADEPTPTISSPMLRQNSQNQSPLFKSADILKDSNQDLTRPRLDTTNGGHSSKEQDPFNIHKPYTNAYRIDPLQGKKDYPTSDSYMRNQDYPGSLRRPQQGITGQASSSPQQGKMAPGASTGSSHSANLAMMGIAMGQEVNSMIDTVRNTGNMADIQTKYNSNRTQQGMHSQMHANMIRETQTQNENSSSKFANEFGWLGGNAVYGSMGGDSRWLTDLGAPKSSTGNLATAHSSHGSINPNAGNVVGSATASSTNSSSSPITE